MTRVDARKAAKLAANHWHDEIADIAGNSNDESNVDSANIDLVKFSVNTKKLLADSVRKTCRR